MSKLIIAPSAMKNSMGAGHGSERHHQVLNWRYVMNITMNTMVPPRGFLWPAELFLQPALIKPACA